METPSEGPVNLEETARRLARGAYLLDKQLVLQKYEPSDVITSLRPNSGGMFMSQPYRGETYDPLQSRVVKGGWDHDHCRMCSVTVVAGDPWWAALPPDRAGLCPDCHALLDRSSQDMRSAGLDALHAKRRRLSRRLTVPMTEEAWPSATVPLAMLMTFEGRARAGELNRKLRLFACACARRVWHLLEDERSREAVEVAERYADGMASAEELDAAGVRSGSAAGEVYVSGGLRAADDARIAGEAAAPDAAGPVFGERAEERAWQASVGADRVTSRKIGIPSTNEWYEGAWVAALVASMSASDALAEAAVLRSREAAIRATELALEAPLTATDPVTGAAELLAREDANDAATEASRYYDEPWQADLLRCIFGNPSRPTAFDPSWLTSATVEMARSIYERRSFDRLSDLAAALEEAGCRDACILGHCREAGEHARGCWVVDALLGKS